MSLGVGGPGKGTSPGTESEIGGSSLVEICKRRTMYKIEQRLNSILENVSIAAYQSTTYNLYADMKDGQLLAAMLGFQGVTGSVRAVATLDCSMSDPDDHTNQQQWLRYLTPSNVGAVTGQSPMQFFYGELTGPPYLGYGRLQIRLENVAGTVLQITKVITRILSQERD